MSKEKDYILSAMPGFDDLLLKEMWKLYSRDGIHNIDRDILQAFYNEFKKRPGLLYPGDVVSESKKKNRVKLTEGQARRAVRKWLFEFATDSGVSHRASTDDKMAGKLGDDREDQPASTIPQDIPIIATSQMSTQLTVDMPPIEDPDFIPGTAQELGRSADLIAQQVPVESIEWFYDKVQEIADEAIEMAQPKLSDLGSGDASDLESQIRPSQRASQESAEATNESWKRWSRMLATALNEAPGTRKKVKRGPKNDPLNLRRRQLSRHDMRLTRQPEPEWLADIDEDNDGTVTRQEFSRASRQDEVDMEGEVIGGEYIPTSDEMEMYADELGMEVDELPGYDPRRHISPEERQANLASGNFDGEAKLRELVAMNIYPSVRTLSGMKKKINADIDPIVQMFATARPAFDWLTGWYDDEYQVSWKGQEISGPDVYQMALQAYQKFYRRDQTKLDQLADALETGGFYTEAMAEIVMAPIVRKWVQEVKSGNLDVSSRKARNNFVMSDWILETVLNSGFGKSGNKRRAKKIDQALQGMAEFKSAMAVAATNDPMPGGDA